MKAIVHTTKSGKRYDRILDVALNRPIFDYKRALSPGGIFIAVGGSGGALFQVMVLGPVISMTGNKNMGILMWKPNRKEDLYLLIELFEAGKLKPVISRRYPLSDTAEALRSLEEGRALGKVVLTVTNSNSQ